MQKNSEQQSVQAVLKKLAHATCQSEVIETLLGERPVSSSPEGLMEELARSFANIQTALRTCQQQDRIPSSRLIDALGEIARANGIPAAKFFPALLEKILYEESEETGRLSPKKNTKQRILDAALDVFSHKGFHTATTDEIAERAGVGKGTLYRHFETKEKLFAELVRLRLDELEKNAGSLIDGSDDVLTMISKYIRIYFEFFDRNQHLYRLIVQEHLDLGEHAPDMYFRKVMRAIPGLKRKVYEGTQQGVLKEVDFQTVFYGTMGFAHGVIEKWLARDCSYSLIEEIPGVLEVLFYGFVKDAGKIGCEN